MTNEIKNYLKYANLQIAAEAFFEFNYLRPTGSAPPGSTSSYPTINPAYLTDGNNRSSKFTAVQAQSFIDEGWTVVEHIGNTASGFSGTLFKNSKTGEQVMSFRSTEFADDATRDNQATNVMEIKAEGWAFGQIADMEAWYASLKAGGKLDARAVVTVTGYSLGGHLATAFNLLHQNDLTSYGVPLIAATYTFNGAGVGTVDAGYRLSKVMSDFTVHRALGGNADLFADPEVLARYSSLKGIFKEGVEVSLAQVDAQMQSLAQQGLTKLEEQTLYKALQRIHSVVYEAERINAGVSSGTDGAAALAVDTANIAATALDYQLAVMRAGEHTEGYRTDPASGGIDAYAGRNLAPGAIANFHDIYGASPPSAVANSQLHYGTATPIFIEDQPLFRGSVIADVGTTSWKAGEVKLLVENFGLNDFGDTHSLVLIVDSLNVQNALAQLDPGITQGTLSAILATASNKKAISTIGAQGQAEGDVMENVLRSLAAMFGVSIEPMAARLNGGTWADANDRAAFYRNLQAVIDSDAYQAVAGNAVIRASSTDLKAVARKDFGVIAALINLSTFWIAGKDSAGEAALETVWESVYGEDFLAWQGDKSASAPATFTDEWIADRARLLSALMSEGRQNSDTGQVYDISVPMDRMYEFKYIGGDIPQGQTQPMVQTLFAKGRDGVVLPVQRIVFGDEAINVLQGTDNALGDHLYGGAGNDTLSGGAGGDYLQGDAGDDILEGGSGTDTLVGGEGADRYVIGIDAGRDLVIDADGRGSISLAGRTLAGAGRLVSAPGSASSVIVWEDDSISDQVVRYVYNSTTHELTIVGAGSTIIVNDFSPGRLGIALPAPSAPEVHDGTAFSFDLSTAAGRDGLAAANEAVRNANLRIDNVGASGNSSQGLFSATGFSGDDVVIVGAVAPATRAYVRGGDGDDRLFGAAETSFDEALVRAEAGIGNGNGMALLSGGIGDDEIYASVGDDVLFGGDGDDLLVGGVGNNIIIADGTADSFGRGDVDLPWSVAGNGATQPRWLYSPVMVAVIGETPPDNFGRRIVNQVFAPIGAIDPLSTVDFSDLVSMQVADVQPDADDDTVYLPGSSRSYFDLHKDEFFATNNGYGDDVVYAGAGGDVVNAGAGDDLVFAGSGDDVVAGYDGDDFLVGGEGDDRLDGDYSFGGSAGPGETFDVFGAAIVVSNTLAPERHGRDLLDGGAGNDVLFGGGASDILYGGEGNDILQGDHVDVVGAFAGDDLLDGGGGDDQLFGGGGNDRLQGGLGDDLLVGDFSVDDGQGNVSDELYGNDGDDVIWGGGGADFLSGGQGNDVLVGDGTFDSSVSQESVEAESPLQSWTPGDDRLFGDEGDDVLRGGAGNDYLEGGTGHDDLMGGAGDDLVSGGDGDDLLAGGDGRDRLAGGRGVDVYTLDGVTSADADTLNFSLGDGYDFIDAVGTGAGGNEIQFGTGIDIGSLQVVRLGGNSIDNVRLLLKYGVDDEIEIKAGAASEIERLRFSDGTMVSMQGLVQAVIPTGTHSDDSLSGSLGEDSLAGSDGDDDLYGLDGADELIGGEGSDVLTGGGGDNTYVFGPGSGTDVIRPTAGETAVLRFEGLAGRALRASQIGADLLISAGPGDIVRIAGYRDIPQLSAAWRIETAAGQLSLGDWLATAPPLEPALLAYSKERFLQDQITQLRTWSQYIAEGVNGSVAMPPTVRQEEVRMVPGEGYAYRLYLDRSQHHQATEVAVVQPVLSAEVSEYPSFPVSGRWSRTLEPTWYSLGNPISGTMNVFSFSSWAATAAPSEPDAAAVGDWQVVGSFSPIPYVSGPVGSASFFYETVYVRNLDVATQFLVRGTEAADIVQAGAVDSGDVALFRGLIETGAGNDQILLGSGRIDTEGTTIKGRTWDWGSLKPGLPANNFARDVRDRGLGAWIDAGEGQDIVLGSDGNDYIIGGWGDDWLDGQAGADTYLIATRENDVDHISDIASFDWGGGPAADGDDWMRGVLFQIYGGDLDNPNRDVVEFDSDIQLPQLSYRWNLEEEASGYKTLELLQNGRYFLAIDYSAEAPPTGRDVSLAGIELFRFSDGRVLSVEELLLAIPREGSGVFVAQPLSDFAVLEDVGIDWKIPVGTFLAPDGESLLLSASLEGGSALPGWLTFDSDSGRLTGTPNNAQVGALQIRIVATEANGQSAADVFQLEVVNVNDAPTVGAVVAGELAEVGAVWRFMVPTQAFADMDEDDELTLQAALADGRALPEWLRFESSTRTFSGTPGSADSGDLALLITATDKAGARASQGFTLTAAPAPGQATLGTAGNDTLNGTVGNDTLDGLAGNDALYGGLGNDIYRWGRNQGSDSIGETGGFDTIVLSGLNVGDIVLRREPTSETAVLIDKVTGQTLRIANAFSEAGGAQTAIEQLIFADGTTWSAAALRAAAQDNASVLIGTASYDNLTGDIGNDVLDGKKGDDTLTGANGNDTYRYRAGDGNDRVVETGSSGNDTLELIDLNASDIRVAEGTGYGDDRIIDRRTGQSITLGLGLTPSSWTNMGYYVEQVKFADGTVWGMAQLKAATNANETLIGTTGADTLEGFGGNDILDGGAGNDVLKGGSGDDTYRYRSTDGDDIILDTAGSDALELLGLNPGDVTLGKTPLGNLELLINATGKRITVTKGLDINTPTQQLEKVVFADGTIWTQASMQAATANVTPDQTLVGTAGYDNLTGDIGNDVLDGKKGDDTLTGANGNDTYRYRSGDGNDRVVETGSNGNDTLELIDLNASDIRVAEGTGYGDDRILDRRTGQSVTLGLGLTPSSWTNMGYYVEQVKFADGTVWGTAQLKAAANANETLTGTAGADTLEGFGGNDVLDGGVGNDTLKGGTGSDGYLFVRGAGSDRVVENDQTAGSVDVLSMGSAIAADQLWLRQSGNDLEVSIIGTSDKMTVADWYLGSQYHVEQFKTSDGKTLLDSQVQNLVQAMAGFAPPAAGQTTLPANYQSSLGTVIAANWQ